MHVQNACGLYGVWCVADNFFYGGSHSKQCKIKVLFLICFITVTSTFFCILPCTSGQWVNRLPLLNSLMIKYLQLKSLL